MFIITAVSMNQGASLLSFTRPHHISILVSDGQQAGLILTRHDALVHQLLSGSPLLKP